MSNKTKFLFTFEDVQDPKLRDVLERYAMEVDRSLRAITPSSISTVRSSVVTSGGGGGGSSGTTAAFTVIQSVTAGTVTVSFPAVASTSYGVHAFVIISGSLDLGLAKPKVPPDTDSRGFTSCQVQVYDTGTLYTFILPPP